MIVMSLGGRRMVKDLFMKVFFEDDGRPLSDEERVNINRRLKDVLASEFTLKVTKVFIPGREL